MSFLLPSHNPGPDRCDLECDSGTCPSARHTTDHMRSVSGGLPCRAHVQASQIVAPCGMARASWSVKVDGSTLLVAHPRGVQAAHAAQRWSVTSRTGGAVGLHGSPAALQIRAVALILIFLFVTSRDVFAVVALIWSATMLLEISTPSTSTPWGRRANHKKV